uniref:Ubiquitin-like protease family profile domain-containing protein n=1 Tax=Leersia perrieri TaxID=77586 RepID=A0A0D9VGW5_9ORYZ
MQAAGITRAQLMQQEAIPVAEAKPKRDYVSGEPFLPADELKTVGTQMHRFQEWYMKASATERDTIGAKIYSLDYFHKHDDYLWIPFKDVFDLYQLDALNVSMVTAWVMRFKGPKKNNYKHVAFMEPRQINTPMVQAQAHSINNSILTFLAQNNHKDSIYLPYNKSLINIVSRYIYSFHWVLFAFGVSHSTVLVFDSMDHEDIFFIEINVDKQQTGTNLCGYYVFDYLHLAPRQFFYDFRYMDLSGKKPCDDMLRAVQEQLMGFINEQILDPAGEFYVGD